MRCLQRLCQHTALLPSSVSLHEELLWDSKPYIESSISSIHQGTYGGIPVVVKVIRIRVGGVEEMH